VTRRIKKAEVTESKRIEDMRHVFGSPEAYTIFTNDHCGPVLQKMLASQTIEKRDRIMRAISEAAQIYAENTTGKSGSKMKQYLLLAKNE
jgi:hypothetical protein